MEFIKAEEARELTKKGVRNELEDIQKEIRKAATNGEDTIYYRTDTKYTAEVVEFLEAQGYIASVALNEDSDYPTLFISWF